MALSSGEQALLDLALKQGKSTVTSSYVPAASLAKVNAELAKRQSQQAPQKAPQKTSSITLSTNPASTVSVNRPGTTPSVTLPITTGLLAGTVNTQASRPANTIVVQTKPAETVITPSGMLSGTVTATPRPTVTIPTTNVTPLPAPLEEMSDEEVTEFFKENPVAPPASETNRITNKTSRSEPQTSQQDTIINEIQRTYQSELKRLPQQEGLDYWTNQVVQGNLTLAQAKDAIANSEEAKLTKELEATYNKYLDRDADEGGLQYFKDQVTQGNLTVDNAKKVIATSEEAKTVNPTQYATTQIYINNLNRMPDEEGLNYWDDQLQKEIEETGDAQQALNNVGQNIINAESSRLKEEAADLFKQKVEEKDATALGTILYDLKSNGQRVTPKDLEELFGPEAEGGYENSTVAFAIARGLEEVDKALASGDTATAQSLQAEMQNPVAFRDKYKGTEFLSNDIEKEIRQTLLTEDSFYGRSSGGGGRGGFFGGIIDSVFDDFLGIDDSGGILGSTKAFVENPIEALDRWKDNPAFRAGLYLIPGYGPLIAATTNIVSKYDTGQTPGLLDWASVATAGADFMAPGGAGAKTATELMDQGVDPSLANKIASNSSATSGALRTAGDVLNTVSGGAQGAINRIIDASGVRETVGAAGQYFEDPALQGLLSGTASATIEQVAGNDPVMAFLQELKGTSIDVLPDSISGSLSGLSGMLGDINLPSLDFNLPDVSLGDLQLAGIDLSGLDLSGINLSGLNLGDITLGDLDLAGIDLSNLTLPNINLPDVNLPNVNLPDVNLPNVNLPDVNLPDVDLAGLELPNVNVPTIKVPGLDVNLPNVDLDLNGIEFPKITTTTLDLPNVTLPDLPNVNLPDLPNIALPNLVGLPELLGPGKGKSGLQKGLPYDLDFLQDEGSLALAILQGRVG